MSPLGLYFARCETAGMGALRDPGLVNNPAMMLARVHLIVVQLGSIGGEQIGRLSHHHLLLVHRLRPLLLIAIVVLQPFNKIIFIVNVLDSVITVEALVGGFLDYVKIAIRVTPET